VELAAFMYAALASFHGSSELSCAVWSRGTESEDEAGCSVRIEVKSFGRWAVGPVNLESCCLVRS
jgi:hypothetical protein